MKLKDVFKKKTKKKRVFVKRLIVSYIEVWLITGT